jgi:hypothetical protein
VVSVLDLIPKRALCYMVLLVRDSLGAMPRPVTCSDFPPGQEAPDNGGRTQVAFVKVKRTILGSLAEWDWSQKPCGRSK